MPVGEKVTAVGVRRLRALAGCVMAAAALAAPCGAATLHPGDLILAQYNYTSTAFIVQIDPVTLAPTIISGRPFVTVPMGVAVDHEGRILVADLNQGIVHVDAVTGDQSVLAGTAALGGTPAGICLAPGGGLFVSVRGGTPGVVRVGADGSSVTPVTSGNRISDPGNLTLGPDGALYVTENSIPADNGGVVNGVRGHGSIVRVDPGSGAQTLVAADSLFLGPFDIAFVGPDEVWTANHGYVAGRRGCFVSTRVSDGASAFALQYSPCRSQGIAVAEDGTVFVSDCNTIGPDCYARYIRRLPDGPELMGYGGPIAVVPSTITPARRSTWGALKTIYR
jgi:sugar lactone lactonase YvrE